MRDRLLTTRQVAKVLGVSPETLRIDVISVWLGGALRAGNGHGDGVPIMPTTNPTERRSVHWDVSTLLVGRVAR